MKDFYSNILYPPIVDDLMPSFVVSEPFKIRFDISDFNNFEDITYPQLTITNIKTNQSALKTDLYPNAIKIYSKTDINKDKDGYFLVVNPEQDLTVKFSAGQFYQAQVRFTSKKIEGTLPGAKQAAWLNENKQHFSEWSRPIIFKPITKPVFKIFDNKAPTIKNETLNLKLEFSSTFSILSSYKIYLFPAAGTELAKKYFTYSEWEKASEDYEKNLLDQDFRQTTYYSSLNLKPTAFYESEWIKLKNNQNDTPFYYELPIFLEDGRYDVYIEYKTEDGYNDSTKLDSVKISYSTEPAPYLEMVIDTDIENGLLEFTLKNSLYRDFPIEKARLEKEIAKLEEEIAKITKEDIEDPRTHPTILEMAKKIVAEKTLEKEQKEARIQEINNSVDKKYFAILKRADHFHNFKKWEHVCRIAFTKDTPVLFWKDFTIESGVWYKYALQLVEEDQVVSRAIITEPIMVEFEHAYLTSNNLQLPLKYNFNVDTLNRSVNLTVTDTLGSLYPVIGRTAAHDYRTFHISGTISLQSDMEKNLFKSSLENLFEDLTDLQKEYLQVNQTSVRNSYVLERMFRENVMEFLYNEQPKLFRSTPEGNILVQLSNISFTPNQTTGRLIYDFSAIATEMADCNLANYNKYKIQDFYVE